MRILICHEQAEFVENLSKRITHILLGENILMDSLITIAQAKQELSLKSYDVAFIGTTIHKESGFDLAQCLKNKNAKCAIVFISNEKQYVYKAFDIKAFQFLPEDVDDILLKKELMRVLLRYKRMHAKCVLYTKKGVKTFYPKEILYIETRDHRIRMMTTYGLYEGNVIDLIKMKSELLYFHFFQIHQSYFVNLEKIASIRRGEIILTDGETIPTSILNRQCVKATIQKFLRLP